jgi:hypothetical protein
VSNLLFLSYYAKFNSKAGSIRPTHSPKPTRASSSSPHTPLIVISSPSSKNVLISPPLSLMGVLPFSLCSKKLPYSDGEVPLIVPDPRRSPGWRGQPVMVWCVNICGKDHTRFCALTLETVVECPEDADVS